MPDDKSEQQEPTSAEGKAVPTLQPKGPRPKVVLPTERIAFPKQLSLLRAFAVAHASSGSAVQIGEAASIAGMTASTASLANSFFIETKLLQRSDRAFLPAEEVTAFNNAAEWGNEDAGEKLAPLIQETWFAKGLIPRLNFKPLEESQAISALAELAGATTDYKTSLRLLIEFLVTAGLIQREGTLLKAVKRVGGGPKASQPAPADEKPAHTLPPAPMPLAQPRAGVHYQFSIDVDMQELGTWGPERIQAFFAGIAGMLAARGQDPKGGSDE